MPRIGILFRFVKSNYLNKSSLSHGIQNSSLCTDAVRHWWMVESDRRHKKGGAGNIAFANPKDIRQ